MIALLFLATSPAAAAEDHESCAQVLTFRWTSGDPVRLDVSRPDAASLENPPFLRDPELLTVTASHDWLGPNATIKVGAAAAALLRKESSSHLHQQMLIMLGDTLVAAAIVPAPLGDVLVLHVADDRQLSRIIDALQEQQRCLGAHS